MQADEVKNGGPKGGAPDERSIKEQLKDKKVKYETDDHESYGSHPGVDVVDMLSERMNSAFDQT